MNRLTDAAMLIASFVAMRMGLASTDAIARAFGKADRKPARSIDEFLVAEFQLSRSEAATIHQEFNVFLDEYNGDEAECLASLASRDDLSSVFDSVGSATLDRAVASVIAAARNAFVGREPAKQAGGEPATPEDATIDKPDPDATWGFSSGDVTNRHTVDHKNDRRDDRGRPLVDFPVDSFTPPSRSVETSIPRTIEATIADAPAIDPDATVADPPRKNNAANFAPAIDPDATVADPPRKNRASASASALETAYVPPGDRKISNHEETIANPDLKNADIIARSGRSAGVKAPGGGESRFQILRKHAKGGLGEVFVAFDLELHREVALKEIQERYADHDESRDRFVLEAEVTGGLEHPGIVPVYGLGRYRDGRPYYAMRFIRGDSLKDAIDQFHAQDLEKRDPGRREIELRRLLARFIDVCDAIAFAHSRGVIHRDIKPANVMLGDFGETLVVDWGLAKALDQVDAKEEGSTFGPLKSRLTSGGSETLAGSTVGTPSYMSPEQARGEVENTGTASDIYSLGATLYHILTGQAPVKGKNVLDLLDKVKRGDFPPPRSVDRRVHRALEAICLKAMALDPSDRYPSARGPARDVERFLADEPVSVYREPIVARLARWAKRRKTLVTTTAALLVVTVIALSIGTVLIRREQARTEANFRLAKAAVDEMLSKFAEKDLAEIPQMERERRAMLAKALDFYLTFLRDRSADRSLRRDVGLARLRLGDIDEMLGDYRGAESAYREALTAFEKSRVDRSIDLDAARTLLNLGVVLKKENRFDEAERDLSAARAIFKKHLEKRPKDSDVVRSINDCVYQLGTLLAKRPGRTPEGEAVYREAIAARRAIVEAERGGSDDLRKLARFLSNWGILIIKSDPPRAESIFREAIALQDKLETDQGSLAGFQFERARTRVNLGSALDVQKRFEEAIPLYEQAVKGYRSLASSFPAVPDYQSELAGATSNWAMALRRLNRDAEAREALSKAIDIGEKLVDRFPDRPDFRFFLGSTISNLGVLLAEIGRKDEAVEIFRRGTKTLDPLLKIEVSVPEYQGAVATSIDRSALLELDRHNLAEARDLFDRAIALHIQAQTASSRSVIERGALLTDYVYLAETLLRMKDDRRCAETAELIVELAPDEFDFLRRAARFFAGSAAIAANRSELSASNRGERRDSYARRAIQSLQRAIKKGLDDPTELDAPAYESIRDRADFKTLRDALRSRAKIQVG